jgi:HAMP domain-containing protein
MAKRQKRRQRVLWTAAHEKQLRKLSGRTPAARIARELGRSEAAVRYKAHTLGISLALKRK